MPILTRPSIDWAAPNYDAIFTQRLTVLDRIRGDARPDLIVADMKAVYREYPAQMIMDWGVTINPKNAGTSKPVIMPFILFEKQVELCDVIIEQWKAQLGLAIPKSREMGVTWLVMALGCTLCTLFDDVAIGTGSRKYELVDDLGNMDAILPKGRAFLKFLPKEFRGGWDERKHTKDGQIFIPDTRSLIDGEAGDDIGRGGRKSLYFVDEAAHLQRPLGIDAALSSNTNSVIEFSSVKGMDNPFARRCHDGTVRVFPLDWRDNPLFDQAWYDAYLERWGATITAQELDRNFSASVDGVILPNLWLQACVDAHIKLNITPSGIREGALDVADLGKDKNAYAGRHGILLNYCEEWPGTDAGDPQATGARAMRIADQEGHTGFAYDADGMGGPALRGPLGRMNVERVAKGAKRLRIMPFQGSRSGEKVHMPDAFVRGDNGKPLDRKNKDYFHNYKAQSYIALRYRVYQTWRAVTTGCTFDPDEIISIDSKLPRKAQLLSELSQPVMLDSATGKLLVDKTPDGMKSPNLADSVMMLFAPRNRGMAISDDLLDSI
jgi:phage terminase large subunit